MGKKITTNSGKSGCCSGQALLILVALAFLPITIIVLIAKSKLKPKVKAGIIAAWCLICVIGMALSSPSPENEVSDRTIPVVENTTPAITTAVTDATTVIETTITESITTTEEIILSDNPLLNVSITQKNTNYGQRYGYISIDKSMMNSITASQLREFVQKYGPKHTWLSVKFSDSTGLYFSTNNSDTTTLARYGKLDEQGAITSGYGSIDFDEDNFKLYYKDDTSDEVEATDTNCFNVEFFSKLENPPVIEVIDETVAPDPVPVERVPTQVYIAASLKGKKYHYDPYCSNMNGDVIGMSIEEAEAQGYTMCGRE